MITPKSPEQLAREDLIRQTWDYAIDLLERHSTNRTYRKAFNVAVNLLRDNRDKHLRSFPVVAPKMD